MTSIRFKFILSNIAMILVPTLLTLVAALIILGSTFHHKGWSSPKEYFQTLSRETLGFYSELSGEIATEPDHFLNKAYLENLSTRMNPYNFHIAVFQKEQLFYTSIPLNQPGLKTELLELSQNSHNDKHPAMIGEHLYGVMHFPVQFTDISSGHILLMTDLSPISDQVFNLFKKIGFSGLLIFIGTNLILTVYMSKSIIQPLRSLQSSAKAIMEGNLEFEVPVVNTDEIGELCQDFNEMRRKLKASLEAQIQYEENRKELVSNISHDLRTPLAAIRGYVEGIEDGIADTPEKQTHYISVVKNRISDMEKLIEDLMLFSKLDTHQMVYQTEAIWLKPFLDEFILDYQQLTRNKGIIFNVQFPQSQHVFINADCRHLRRILINLLDNALNAVSDAQGSISLNITPKLGSIALSVSDNGKGIEPEHIEKVFQRFYRTDSARTSRAGGSGLGLAIVKQLVEGMNGQVDIKSTPGKGTVVTIFLPGGIKHE